MPSAPTEILSYESRTSIGDKIRKEGVFRKKRLAILFHLALYIYRRGAKCASSHFCVATELLDEIMIIQRKISSVVIWCNLRLQNAVLCKNKTKALRANIILADHLSVCKKVFLFCHWPWMRETWQILQFQLSVGVRTIISVSDLITVL